jgi:hypothetical protein
MEDRNRMTNEGGGQTHGGKPRQGGGQQGGQDEGGRQEEGGKGGARPSPSGVPNEGRSMEGQGGREQFGRPGRDPNEYKGGRQGQGGVPNPDDVDDDKSTGSFRRTVDEDSKEGDEDDSEQDNDAHQSANTVLHSGLRNPK